MFTFKVVPDDPAVEPFELTAGMRDLRLWEKTNKGRGLGMLGDKAGVSVVILFEIATAAATRQRKVPIGTTADEFAEAYEIELQDDESEGTPEAADPTP